MNCRIVSNSRFSYSEGSEAVESAFGITTAKSRVGIVCTHSPPHVHRIPRWASRNEVHMSSMAMIDQFVSQPALALMGMSRSGKKFGNFAYRALVSKGYRVYPIHPDANDINGVRCYSDFADLPSGLRAHWWCSPPQRLSVQSGRLQQPAF